MLSNTGNSRQSRPGRRSVANRSQSITGQSEVSRKFMLIDLQMACEGRELPSLSWCGRKSLLLLGQLYTFVYLYVSHSLNSMIKV